MHITQSLAAVSSSELWVNSSIGSAATICYIIAAGLLVTTAIAWIFARDTDIGHRIGVVSAVLGLIAALAALLFVAADQKAERTRVSDARITYFADRGILVTSNDLLSLGLPDSAPTKDTRFGITQGEAKGKIVSIRVEWKNGELKLYSTDGQELHPVKAQR